MTVALDRWQRDGVPDNPGAWLTHGSASQGHWTVYAAKKFGTKKQSALARNEDEQETEFEMIEVSSDSALGDDRLRLIFTCCHPRDQRRSPACANA